MHSNRRTYSTCSKAIYEIKPQMLFCNPSGIPSQISLSNNRVKRPDNRQHDEDDQKHPKDTDLKLRGHILLNLLIIEVVINDGKSLMKDGQILSVGQQADFPEDPLGQHRICRGEEVLGGYFTPLRAVVVDVNWVWVATSHHLRVTDIDQGAEAHGNCEGKGTGAPEFGKKESGASPGWISQNIATDVALFGSRGNYPHQDGKVR
ncbi:hypothetical protein K456DRAFT_41061 [Colletotrichum gloeosporioides 23]|nr:hypothetical protein K456DRAFT_41061 [Colletotrichum gloeosporioides 23]